MKQVQWIKLQSGEWCGLETVDLSAVTAQGVYAIWHDGAPPRMVKVGQDDIAARLNSHKADPAILAYRKFGTLRVTWAAVQAADRDGVERYLANCYSPLVAERFPDVPPIEVNLP